MQVKSIVPEMFFLGERLNDGEAELMSTKVQSIILKTLIFL